jgi:type IV pilus assembly protein PilN
MRIRLNLATKALETHRKFLAGAGLVAIVAGIVFLAFGWHVYSMRKIDAELRARAQKTRQEMVKLEEQRSELERYFSQKDIAELNARAAFINGIIDASSFNWTQMFMDLERILPGGVHVVSIEPKQVQGRVEVKLTVGATSGEAELKFLRALGDSREFTEVQVQNIHVPNRAGNQDGDQEVIQLTTVYSRI